MATKTMTPSDEAPMYDEQIEKFVDKFRAALRKHRDEITSTVAQQVHGVENLGMELFAVIRKHAEDISKRIVHLVTVDRTRTPQQALDASGRKQYVTREVVDGMPRRTGDKAKLVYFKPDPSAYKDGWLSCDKLAEEYAKRGLVPDPQAQIDDNAANSEFADATPNACQWKDADGKYCYATFSRWLGERRVYVYRSGRVWRDDWSFAGVPQESSAA